MANDDYILRSDAVSAFCGNCKGTEVCGQLGEPCEEVKQIKVIPAADVAPVIHAKWLHTKNFSGLKCSNCKARVKNGADRTHNWCYKCGAKMDAEPPKEEEDGAID